LKRVGRVRQKADNALLHEVEENIDQGDTDKQDMGREESRAETSNTLRVKKGN